MTTNKPKIKNAISLKLNNQAADRQERLNKWLDAQSNYTNSLFSLIEHMIDRFGYEDITSHEISKRLFLERITYAQEDNVSKTTPVTVVTPVQTEILTGKTNSPVRTETTAVDKEKVVTPKSTSNKCVDVDEKAFFG